MKVSRIFELLLVWLTAIILPAKLYIILIGAFIFINLILKVTVKYSKKTDQLNNIDIIDILKKSIRDVGIYSIAILGICWLDIKILNDVFLGFFPAINLLSTKFTTVLLLTPEFIDLNRNIKYLTGASLVERFKLVIKQILNLKKLIKEIKD